MALILHLETSTTVCSVCLAESGQLLSLRETNDGYTHAENLTVFAEEVLKDAAKTVRDLDAVTVSIGPGSYTGLRIGLSTAKGLCYALNIPLITIGSLHALALGLNEEVKGSYQNDYLLCPMIDARRMEVYCEVFDKKVQSIHPVSAKIMDEHSFNDLLSKQKIIFAGDGAAKCSPLLSKNINAVFLSGFVASSKYMVLEAEEMYKRKDFTDIVLSEPFYLKDFVPGVKKG
jgi:tRNA threonylcarbamoyladenosine biosynthesis protein TsaB